MSSDIVIMLAAIYFSLSLVFLYKFYNRGIRGPILVLSIYMPLLTIIVHLITAILLLCKGKFSKALLPLQFITTKFHLSIILITEIIVESTARKTVIKSFRERLNEERFLQKSSETQLFNTKRKVAVILNSILITVASLFISYNSILRIISPEHNVEHKIS